MIYTNVEMALVGNFIILTQLFIIIARSLMEVIFLTIRCTMASYSKDHQKIGEDQE